MEEDGDHVVPEGEESADRLAQAMRRAARVGITVRVNSDPETFDATTQISHKLNFAQSPSSCMIQPDPLMHSAHRIPRINTMFLTARY